jgi:hypothetical protein
MVAYSFKPSFLDDIAARVKRQTIRLPRKRHARPGEAIQLFTGSRMRPVRVGAAICVRVHDVRLDFSEHTVILDDAMTIDAEDGFEALNAFAVRDGFTPGAHLAQRGNLGLGIHGPLLAPDSPGRPDLPRRVDRLGRQLSGPAAAVRQSEAA